jgi:hypothetical protein
MEDKPVKKMLPSLDPFASHPVEEVPILGKADPRSEHPPSGLRLMVFTKSRDSLI